jgi:glucose dehydrogenase
MRVIARDATTGATCSRFGTGGQVKIDAGCRSSAGKILWQSTVGITEDQARSASRFPLVNGMLVAGGPMRAEIDTL